VKFMSSKIPSTTSCANTVRSVSGEASVNTLSNIHTAFFRTFIPDKRDKGKTNESDMANYGTIVVVAKPLPDANRSIPLYQKQAKYEIVLYLSRPQQTLQLR